jgi:hypothetical protein
MLMSELAALRAELKTARDKVNRKTFAQVPELFKDIESVKVRIALIAPPPVKPVQSKPRHFRKGRPHGK